MIAGLWVATHLFVDGAAAGEAHQLVAEIDVIDAPTPIPVPGTGAVVPPTPVTGIGLKHPEGVLETVPQGFAQGRPLRIACHDRPIEAIGVVDVPGLKRDVEVPHHAKRLPSLGLGVEVALQASKPGQLVGVFL